MGMINVMEDFNVIIRKFLNKLDELSESYEEFLDTDVRDAIFEVICPYLVWGMKIESRPKVFEMYTAAGDEDVSRIVCSFIREINSTSFANVELGQARLDILQDETNKSSTKKSFIDYVGFNALERCPKSVPDHRFEEVGYE